MDILLIIIGGILLITGLLGCILPVIPGPPLSYGGVLLLHFTDYADFSVTFLLVFAIIAIIVTVLDYFIPIWGTRKYGGTKYGMWGATIGIIVGIFFFPPFGIIIGPIIGTFIAENIRGYSYKSSMKAAWGAFVGFMLGTGLKLITSLILAFYFIKKLIF